LYIPGKKLSQNPYPSLVLRPLKNQRKTLDLLPRRDKCEDLGYSSGCNLQNYTMILVHFQGKPFSIIVIQVYAPTTDAEEAEVAWFYENL